MARSPQYHIAIPCSDDGVVDTFANVLAYPLTPLEHFHGEEAQAMRFTRAHSNPAQELCMLLAEGPRQCTQLVAVSHTEATVTVCCSNQFLPLIHISKRETLYD